MVDINVSSNASQYTFSLNFNGEAGVAGQVEIASSDPIIADLIAKYGSEAVGQAMASSYLAGTIERLKAEIDSSDLPQGVKDEAKAKLDAILTDRADNVPPELQSAVDNSTLGQQAREAGGKEAGEVSAQAKETAAAGGAPAEGEAAAGEAAAGEAGEGEEASAAGGGGMTAVEDEDEKNTKGNKGKSWLIALADGLAKLQSHFLDKAMANLDAMESSKDSESSSEFMKNQAEFQANMKMFGMMAEATSTALKTIGEALSSLARKQ